MIRWADKTQGWREKTNVQTVAYIRHRSLKLFVLLLCELVWTTVYSTEYCSTQCVWVYMLIVSVVVIGNICPGKIRTVKNVNTVGGNKIWSVTKFTEEFRRVDEVLGGLKHHSHATHTHTKCNGAFKRSLSTLNAWNRFTAYKLYCISWFDFFLGQNLLSSHNDFLINKLSNYFGRYLIT